jgi:uncharacterized Zn-binding protein involved in type VI secretion
MTGLAFLATVTSLQAQATPKTERVKGVTQYHAVKMTGEVVWVQGDTLVAKMRPSGSYRVFNVQPGREFVIDGQTKHIGDLKPGTMLNATFTTHKTPVTLRTTSSLNGTVWWVQNNYVILTLENGEQKEYTVPPSFKFIVEGKPASVSELKQGMDVTATKIANTIFFTEELQTEYTSTE